MQVQTIESLGKIQAERQKRLERLGQILATNRAAKQMFDGHFDMLRQRSLRNSTLLVDVTKILVPQQPASTKVESAR